MKNSFSGWVRIWISGITVVASCLLVPLSFAGAAHKQSKTHVVGWIPAYAIEKSRDALNADPEIAKGLTRIGLQFWNPSPDGKGLVLAPINETGAPVTPRQIHEVVRWAKARKIQVMLTVYNNSQVMKKWDWALARRAFAENPKIFSAALLKEMKKYDLDGIDLDLEGEGHLDADRQAYASFVKNLSRQLQSQGKFLTVDSFHSPCVNAPNMSWWRDWQGYVDAIHSMGYQDLYEGSTATFTPEGGAVCENGAAMFKYSWQLNFGRQAGFQAHQIVMGFPTWLAAWGEGDQAAQGGIGTDVLDHLKEAKQLKVGIALWDLQLAAPKWRQAATWKAIQQLRQP
ncbi:glycosyl hydrolase family 18 protein [Undibacterium cyanobacteriorum]|uniref:Glycosyl hydrolase family 18 protein n=1 Tax=Undibacterium cyanobacteriorum TaxID=3073561 RepID=A0ABY9RG08_9BURK|nr:glycosyl hydrolase family 18 protein [Undibacterium sp. 20NA77.5]WMW80147.1 glycosyl hydrolase family 18 protein [Undibacterium sp. 20NA77.5]